MVLTRWVFHGMSTGISNILGAAILQLPDRFIFWMQVVDYRDGEE